MSDKVQITCRFCSAKALRDSVFAELCLDCCRVPANKRNAPRVRSTANDRDCTDVFQTEEFYAAARRAASFVLQAVRRGILRPVRDQQCVDCGQPAKHYDHADYSRPLHVEPVCRGCNKLRGAAILSDPSWGSSDRTIRPTFKDALETIHVHLEPTKRAISDTESAAIILARAKAGGRAALRRKLIERGHRINSPSVISGWSGSGVPLLYCPDIEDITGVRCEDLRPDFKWALVRAKPGRRRAATETEAA